MDKSLLPPFLIDFDGVINLHGEPAPYSKEFFDLIKRRNLPAFILSNSTHKTNKDVINFLISNNLPHELPIMTAADATLKYIEKNYERISVYCVENVKKEFVKYIDDENPQAVVIGDLVENWSVDILNEIFLKVRNGADLIAMHLNRYWSPEKDRYILDAGSFIKSIEYASSKTAFLIGKPSSIYYQTALEMLGCSKESPFLMLGDDIELDISPVQKMGGKAILILTGKTKRPLPSDMCFLPDYVANDLSDVTNYLNDFYRLE